MLQVKTPALVLEKEPGWNDEGNITLFTKNFGLVKVVASGVYRPGARLASWTEPPSRVVAEIALREKSPGYGRLFTLTLKDSFPHIRATYQNSSWYYFYCFLLRDFLPVGEKSAQLYNLTKEVLSHQDSWESEAKRDFNFTYFLVRLLRAQGVCSRFSCCTGCDKQFEEDETVYFSLNEQGLLCSDCSQKIISQNSIGISLNYLSLLPVNKKLKLPAGLLRIHPEERKILETCENSDTFATDYANIFSRSSINDQTLAKVRNFLLIFLAPLLYS